MRHWYPAVLSFALVACGSEPVLVTTRGQDQPLPGAVLLGEHTLSQQVGKYAPRNDCGQESGGRAFRDKLAHAALANDAEAIAALASPNIKLGFAGDDGRERFLAELKNPDGKLMAEIKRLLPLGCAVSKEGSLVAPWYFAQDMGDIDGYAATIVTGEDVPLHAAADATSPVRRRISWDLVELNAGLYPERDFQQVEAADGTKGFMPTAKLRSLLDYRLLADREDGEWKITAIVAGD